MTDIRDVFKDILEHTHGLGIYEMIKIAGSVDDTTVEAVDLGKTVILKAKLDMVPDFVDSVAGLSRLSVLDGYLNYPGFGEDSADVKVIKQERNGEEIPQEVSFTAPDGTDAHYRFMPTAAVDLHLKEIKFKGAEYDFSVVPSAKNRSDLAYFNGVLSAFEGYFIPRIEDGHLYFYIGDESGDRTKVLISDTDGKIDQECKWPLDIMLKILRLGDNAVISFAPRLIEVKVDSDHGVYTYLLPAKKS